MLVSEWNGKSPRPRGGNNAILLCYTVYPEEDHTAKKKKSQKTTKKWNTLLNAVTREQ